MKCTPAGAFTGVLPREDASAADSGECVSKVQLYLGARCRGRVSFMDHSFILVFCFLFAVEKQEEWGVPKEGTLLSHD